MTNEQTEKYKKEMMQFYEMQKKNNPVSEPERPESLAEESVSAKYPDPELPEYIASSLSGSVPENEITVSEADDEKAYGSDIPLSGSGIIRTEVRTGNNALPVEDAFVVITRSDSGKKELVAALMTNKSGETISVNIPAPDSAVSQNIPFATVDISTSKNGFQTVVNLDVPVYSGVSTIQPVNLVPVPAGAGRTPDHEVLYSGTAAKDQNTEES